LVYETDFCVYYLVYSFDFFDFSSAVFLGVYYYFTDYLAEKCFSGDSLDFLALADFLDF